MERTSPLIFFRNDRPGSVVECGRREMTPRQRVTFYQERKKDENAFDLELLDGFNQGRAEDERADGFSFGDLRVHVMQS